MQGIVKVGEGEVTVDASGVVKPASIKPPLDNPDQVNQIQIHIGCLLLDRIYFVFSVFCSRQLICHPLLIFYCSVKLINFSKVPPRRKAKFWKIVRKLISLPGCIRESYQKLEIRFPWPPSQNIAKIEKVALDPNCLQRSRSSIFLATTRRVSCSGYPAQTS